MEPSRGVAVVAPAGSSLGVALLAALRSHGWDARPAADVRAEHAGHVTLLLVEDDAGVSRLVVPRRAMARGVVAVGSVRSLPLLISLAGRGVRVLNQEMPFAPLLALVEQALREPAERSTTPSHVAALRRRAAEHAALSRLTDAEVDALDGMVAGLSAAEIARRSHRSLHTVRSHIKAVLAKLEVNSQVAAVAVVHRSGPTAWVRDSARFLTALEDDG